MTLRFSTKFPFLFPSSVKSDERLYHLFTKPFINPDTVYYVPVIQLRNGNTIVNFSQDRQSLYVRKVSFMYDRLTCSLQEVQFLMDGA
jgi:hypothetical protein